MYEQDYFGMPVSREEALKRSEHMPSVELIGPKSSQIITPPQHEGSITQGRNLVMPDQKAVPMPDDIVERMRVQRALDELSLAFRNTLSPVRLLAHKTNETFQLSAKEEAIRLRLVQKDQEKRGIFNKTQTLEEIETLKEKLKARFSNYIDFIRYPQNYKTDGQEETAPVDEAIFIEMIAHISDLGDAVDKLPPEEKPEQSIQEMVVDQFERALESNCSDMDKPSDKTALKMRVQASLDSNIYAAKVNIHTVKGFPSR